MAYRKATWLADVLRRAGLQVIEYKGWQDRGRPPTVGRFDPRAIIVHHDASSVGASDSMDDYIVRGRSGTPGPLSQIWVDYSGRWHVLASGRANHAGIGEGFGVIPPKSGNTYAIGIEVDHTKGEPWTRTQYKSLVQGTAALAKYMRLDVDRAVCGHKEYARGRKIDPWGVNMDVFRRHVRAAVAPPTKARREKPSGAKPRQAERRHRTHVVQRGETLSAIAGRYKTSVDTLCEINKIKDKNKIKVGQVLRVPVPA